MIKNVDTVLTWCWCVQIVVTVTVHLTCNITLPVCSELDRIYDVVFVRYSL